MDSQQFIANFAAQFDETDVESFSLETNFREIEEWSSLTALSVMAMVEEEYNVALKGDEIRNAQTIQDLFDAVKAKV
jgi:acyl carrier protein